MNEQNYFEIDVPDDNILEIDIPPGTDESHYDVLADDAKRDYVSKLTPLMDRVAGEATKAAVMPVTAPAQVIAGKDPTQMPDADTINTVADRGKKIWETAGIPARGIEGLTSVASDVGGALRRGEMPPGEDWKTVVQRASNVVEGKQHLPKVAGFLAGALDPRFMALGEAVNPVVKWGAGAVADKMGPVADWLAERVLQYSKKLVGNEFSRGLADAASEFATKPHPELQQAIMDVTERAAPKAAGKVAGPVAGAGESLVKQEGASALPDDLTALGAGEEKGLAVPEKGVTHVPPEPEGPALEGDVVGGSKGAEYDPRATAGEEQFAPEGIESLDRPIISAGVGTDEMYHHVADQLKVVGDAVDRSLERLGETGELWDPNPTLKQLKSMYHRNQAGSIIPPWDFSEQGHYNQAVDKVINTIKNAALDNDGNIHSLTWKEANQVKGIVQNMANYQKPKFDPENMLYKAAGSSVRDSIDEQGAKALAQNGQDIQPFQALRDGYSKLKVLEESLNNKFAVEKSAKSAIPVLRTAGAGALFMSGKPGAAIAMISDYLIRKYGPEIGTQMARSIAENAGAIGTAAGNVGRAVPVATHAIRQGLQGD